MTFEQLCAVIGDLTIKLYQAQARIAQLEAEAAKVSAESMKP